MNKKVMLTLTLCIVMFSFSTSNAYVKENHYLTNMSATYKWGSNMSSTSVIKTGWQDAVSEWNNAGTYITRSVSSQNVLESRARGSSAEWGLSLIYKYDEDSYSAVHFFTCYMNSTKGQWTANIAQSVGIHELGHVLGLAHNNVTKSIMNENRNRSTLYTIQQDDENGIAAIYN